MSVDSVHRASEPLHDARERLSTKLSRGIATLADKDEFRRVLAALEAQGAAAEPKAPTSSPKREHPAPAPPPSTAESLQRASERLVTKLKAGEATPADKVELARVLSQLEALAKDQAAAAQQPPRRKTAQRKVGFARRAPEPHVYTAFRWNGLYTGEKPQEARERLEAREGEGHKPLPSNKKEVDLEALRIATEEARRTADEEERAANSRREDERHRRLERQRQRDEERQREQAATARLHAERRAAERRAASDRHYGHGGGYGGGYGYSGGYGYGGYAPAPAPAPATSCAAYSYASHLSTTPKTTPTHAERPYAVTPSHPATPSYPTTPTHYPLVPAPSFGYAYAPHGGGGCGGAAAALAATGAAAGAAIGGAIGATVDAIGDALAPPAPTAPAGYNHHAVRSAAEGSSHRAREAASSVVRAGDAPGHCSPFTSCVGSRKKTADPLDPGTLPPAGRPSSSASRPSHSPPRQNPKRPTVYTYSSTGSGRRFNR